MQKLLSALYSNAKSRAKHPALLFVKGNAFAQFSFEDLLYDLECWATFFTASSLETGGVIAIVLDHRFELYSAFLGAMRAGFVPTFLPYPTPKQNPDQYWNAQADVLGRLRPTAIVTYREVRERVARLTGVSTCIVDVDDVRVIAGRVSLPPLEEVEAEDRVALLQHSSGTTGAKKGVGLTFSAIREQTHAHVVALGASRDDKTITWLPLYHDMGLFATFLQPITVGSSIISIDAFDWLLRPSLFFDMIEKYGATHTWLPNFAFNHLVRTHDPTRVYDLSSLRALVNCSEPCKPATFEKFFETFGPHGLARDALRCCYAMAETVFACTLTERGAIPRTQTIDAEALATRNVAVTAVERGADYLSCGRPLAGLDVRIAANEGQNVGEVQLKGGFVFHGYFKNPEATAESFVDGWYKTGDIGFLYDGDLYVCGRSKEMLIVHGQNFYAHDIEAIVDGVFGIKPGRTVAFGKYNESTASEEAIVLAESDANTSQERAALERRVRATVFSVLGLQLRNVQICSVGELIKTTSGKMSRSENVKRYEEPVTSAPR